MHATEWVAEQHACPGCGERDLDALVWNTDGDTVVCDTCGQAYRPHEQGGSVRGPADETGASGPPDAGG